MARDRSGQLRRLGRAGVFPLNREEQGGETKGRDDRSLWYVAFGSNLLRERFLVYLTGGPIPGSTTGKVQDGARDVSPPTGDQPFVIERTLLFCGRSDNWGGGGTAAVDADHNPVTPTLARAYRITSSQFEDVFRQENREPELIEINVDHLANRKNLDLSQRKYGRLSVVGEIDGEMAATITTPTRPNDLRPADPSYLVTMARGLMSSHGLTAKAAADYLASRPGNAGWINPAEFAATIT